jgi:NADH dehydrogenase FAD-containing subunit
MLLTKDTVAQIGADHVVTHTGNQYPADAIIFATGFLTRGWLHPIKVKGVDGRDMHEAWDASGVA